MPKRGMIGQPGFSLNMVQTDKIGIDLLFLQFSLGRELCWETSHWLQRDCLSPCTVTYLSTRQLGKTTDNEILGHHWGNTRKLSTMSVNNIWELIWQRKGKRQVGLYNIRKGKTNARNVDKFRNLERKISMFWIIYQVLKHIYRQCILYIF